MPSKMPTWQHFLRVLAPKVSSLNQEFGQDKNENPNYDQEEELWCQEFLLLAKNMGSLDNGLSFGRPSYEVALSMGPSKCTNYCSKSLLMKGFIPFPSSYAHFFIATYAFITLR
jgi:hypothetical protein